MPILFHTVDVDFKLPQKRIIKKWISLVISSYNFKVGDINYIFCSDSEILKINTQYLNHNYYTDIITFPFSDRNTVSADMYISIHTVAHNASKYQQSFETELNRVMVHGVLHLLGFNDSNHDEVNQMRQAEDSCLALLNNLA
ncbi:MAG: rRNA maturation RNase YbeY [Tenuifilaceae bacterium]|nr:rRNA maturation RNase YbeY [Tenuifilaceae bacterium]